MKIKGVYTQPNHMSEVPEGALSLATNCVHDRDSLLEPRRGLKRYGDAVGGGSAAIRRIFSYQNTLLAHFGSTLKRDNGDGTWTAYSGTFAEPAAGFRVRDAQSNKNLYLTTAAGVKKLDVIGGAFRDAGSPQPLDAVTTLTGSGGFLADDTTVAYRAVLLYEDENENQIVSAPSGRVIVPNSAGGARDVQLQWYLPTGLDTAYAMKIYRSAATAALLDEPSDELQLVLQIQLTSGNISAGYLTTTDVTPDSLRGETLYTSPSQQGIQNQNDQPPFAHDIVLFKNHMLYFNVRSKHRLQTNLIGAGPGALTFVEENGSTTNASAIVTGLDTTDMHVGMRAKASAGIPDEARILTIDSGTQVTLTENATATGARDIEFQDIVEIAGTEYFAASATSLVNHEFEATIDETPATNIELTTLSLVFCVNQDPTNTMVYAFYTSGFEEIPGKFEIVERTIGGASFTADSTSPDSFNAPLPKTSSNSAAENTIMSAKIQQPEAVPLKNKFPAGAEPIRRGLALRDAAFALSDKIYRFFGDNETNFDVDVHDSTVKLIAPETAVVFNDSIYCYSDQGVVRITSSGVAVVSRAIEDDLQRVSSDLFSQFPDTAFGVGYESARRYILFVPDEVSDSTATKAWIFNAFTNSWTGPWQMSRTAGFVNPADDKLYLGDEDFSAIFQERKTFSRLDYADEEFETTIVSSSSTTVTLSSTADVEVGYLLKQDFREALVTEVTDGTTLEVDSEIEWEAGDALAIQPIETEAKWVPLIGGNPVMMKHWQYAHLIFRDADFANLDMSFATDFSPQNETITLFARDLEGAWGAAPFGSIPWGVPQRGEQVLRAQTPIDRSRSHWLVISVQASAVFSSFKIAGLNVDYLETSERFAQTT